MVGSSPAERSGTGGPAGTVQYVSDAHEWVVRGGRLVDDTSHVRISLADIELPDGVQFTQYVFRMRRCAMTVVLDDAGDPVLLLRRFIVDRWGCRAATRTRPRRRCGKWRRRRAGDRAGSSSCCRASPGPPMSA
jgi:hypothetical protein